MQELSKLVKLETGVLPVQKERDKTVVDNLPISMVVEVSNV